jgi:4-diphosphocytidyl-2-C-methyl-D-erythritol kinase
VSTAAADLPDELIVNDLEPAARALCPEIDEAIATARQVGAHHALVCGSGPTVIGLFGDLRGARGAAARLSERTPRPVAVAPWGATL